MEAVGTIKRVIFRNEENGFSVLELANEAEKGKLFSAVGVIPLGNAGERMELSGAWVEHKVYGRQFRVNEYRLLTPSTLSAIVGYLSSGLITGVGDATARAIVTTFGEDTLSVLENEPKRLLEIPGIGELRAQKIAASYASQKEMRDVMIELQKFDISIIQAIKLYKLYGRMCIKVISENPYRLIDDVEGVGFKTADKLAFHAGIDANAPMRLEAGVRYTLSWARAEGHTYLPREKLVEVATRLLNADILPVERCLEDMLARGLLSTVDIDGDDAVFQNDMRLKESECARKLLSLNKKTATMYFSEAKAAVSRLEGHFGISLAKEQSKAVVTAISNGVTVITGGPGTGKTTILKFIIKIFDDKAVDYELCAPTGRAAKRMTEATGVEARTIHRLLESGGNGEGFAKNEENQVETDALIVDEASMIDVPLMYALLRATHKDTQLILVGDADQLPPVGAGNALRDIISSGTVPVVRLNEVFRQAERGLIVENAHRINNGQKPLLAADSEDFRFDEMPSAEEAIKRVIGLCKGKTNKLLTNDPLRDVQVLAPMKKGALGVHNLNACLQEALNPASKQKAEHKRGDTVFREGDKVMQIRNNYRLQWTKKRHGKPAEMGDGAYNGDLGTIVSIDTEYHTLCVLFDDERLAQYEFTMLEDLELAYCISIHKSQGSEFPVVLLPLMGGTQRLLTRNLLYTAVTRAREQVYIVGSEECVAAMVQNADVKRRYSGLAHFLRAFAAYDIQ